ncbi:ABC transporter ATP-binding protein [Dictyobacter arantiisoli]|uniref:Multidrug ABC transporter permease n=1 Tax=Dictyobacter arantiisoli TaxID=2014874 RepID=A0A5A5TED2_9CHLR|nr:ABC transporter ATP-binding protein [Dictyobacter arantiisoli]GCF09687.1 multidrug ABC transporter permease [Dictyobacter arantiisoli]
MNTISQSLLQDQVANHIQLSILHKANTLDLSFFENTEFYDKLRHAREETNYKPVILVSEIFDTARTLITLVSMLILLLQLAWWLMLVAFIIPIPSFIASSRYGWRRYRRMRAEAPERRKMWYLTHVLTVDDYNKEVKLFNLGDFFIARYVSLMETFYDENKKLIIPRNLSNFAWSAITVIANSSIYLYVALQAVLGRIKLGGLVKYTQASIQAGTSFQSVLDGISTIYENTLYVNTLFEFMEYQPIIVSPPQPATLTFPVDVQGLDIEFRDVSFTYPGKTEAALSHINFVVKAGESVALVGRNGAGKTTLVKLLTRLYDPDEGEILIGGHSIRDYNLEDLRQHVGVIFQDFVRYHLTASENIGIGRLAEIENRDFIEQSAQKSGADAVIEKLDNGYDTMLGRWFKEGAQLSGGEWQKVALARAFMRDARILILDEPTSALDPQSEYDVFTRFRQLTTGKTAIFISHRFSTVRLADRIIVIEHGRMLEIGSHQELIALDGRYAELFNLQAEAYR